MAIDNMQSQRLELKYIVQEQVALEVRDFVRSYLAADEFCDGKPDFSYPIHSLYLDSDALTMYWHTINGNKNRYKLRVRYYDDHPESPVFFEVKRRMNNAILKQRGAVKRGAVDELLAGQLPETEQLFSNKPEQLIALERFCQLMQHHEARPKAHVAYRREAWVSPHNNSVRVTMDRDIYLSHEPFSRLQTKQKDPVRVFGDDVVLELKFTGRFPDWFGELTRFFNLTQCCAAKYADGVTLLRKAGENFGCGEITSFPEDEEAFPFRRREISSNAQRKTEFIWT